MIRMNRFTLSHESVTCHRSPEVSSTAFDAQPPDLPPVSLMDMGFAIIGPLARHRRPPIRFLFIGSHLCSALLSGPASRRVLFHPCASLSLHVHHVVKRTFTSKLSNMLGTPKNAIVLRRLRREHMRFGTIQELTGLSVPSAFAKQPGTHGIIHRQIRSALEAWLLSVCGKRL